MQIIKSIRLPEMTIRAIQKQAKVEGLNFSQLIKKAVLFYLSTIETKSWAIPREFKPRKVAPLTIVRNECACLEVHTCGK